MRGDISLLLVGYFVGMLVILGAAYFYVAGSAQSAANVTATPTAAVTAEPTANDIFGIGTATPTPAPTEAPRLCGDGTLLGSCNSRLEACKDERGTAVLVEDCRACGCGFGKKCLASTGVCFVGCDDGTPLDSCSNATPMYYCNGNSSLEINGFKCGCPMGYQYDPYGSGPNTVNGCSSTCRAGPDCKPGK